MKFFFTPLLLTLIAAAAIGQNNYSIQGRVQSNKNKPLPLVTVHLEKTDHTTITDSGGVFGFSSVKPGQYLITLSAVGYQTLQSTISVSQNLHLAFTVQDHSATLDSIHIVGRSRARLLSEQPTTITSLDLKKIAERPLGAEEVLKTASGVVVRQSGGLGSQLNINLNGLTGEAVRIYYDGIPIQAYGYGLQLNNIPVDALQRIDVYKGVMPVQVGTDALGGGINLVPLQASQSELRATYSIGSFNTHRATFNGTKIWNKSTSLSISSFYNRSDNDYKMRDIPNLSENLDEQGNVLSVREDKIDARRFHNQHQSSFIEASLSLRDRSWTDQLTLSASHSYRFDEIQQGRFIINTAVGEATTKVNGWVQRLDYRKRFFAGKLNVRYFGIRSNAFSTVRDSTTAIYNWTGQVLKTKNTVGSEIFSFPTLRQGRDLSTAQRLITQWQIADNTLFKLSDFFSYTRIKGTDAAGRRLPIGEQTIDPNTIPSKITKNVLGAELEQGFLQKRMTAMAFYKNYQYRAESIDILNSSATLLPVRKVADAQNGYGLALKFDIISSFFVRASFERAVRIPTDFEVFGDFTTILPNYNLRPEVSDNMNAGLSYANMLGTNGHISIQVDGFLRNQKNLIRLKQIGLENANYVNEAAVAGSGIELTSRICPFKNLEISANITYQTNRIAAVGDEVSSASIGLQIPNIPQFFYNAGAAYHIPNLFHTPNHLKLFWTYFYTDRFSINEVANLDEANPIFVIPVQHLHNAGTSYSLVKQGITLSLYIQNVFDAPVYDNFRIPRPGVNYAFKINYSLNK